MNKFQMTYQGVDFQAFFRELGVKFSIERISGRGLITNEITSRPVPGADGEIFLKKSLPARVLEVAYNLIADDSEALREAEYQLNGLLQVSQPQRIEFEDQDGYYIGIQSNTGINFDEKGWQKGTIEFFCAKPFLYGNEITSNTDSLSANEVKVIEGVRTNYQVLPKLTYVLTSAANIVTFDVNGRDLIYTGTLPAGAVIVIDGEKKELRVNGVLKVMEVSGWFPYFLSGENTFTASVAGTFSCSYQERHV